MGLDVHVGEYETKGYVSERLGAYSGYARWRIAIANAAGFDLDEMDGFDGIKPWTTEPFQLILNHSDCDGGYSIEQIPELLQELYDIKILNVDDYEQSDKLIRLCKVALSLNLSIEFA